MENKNGIILITAFVMIILGVVLIGSIAEQSNLRTSKTAVVAESQALTMAGANVSEKVNYTVANAPTGWKVDDCPLTLFILRNDSNQTKATTLTVDTDYTLDTETGVLHIINTTATYRAFVGKFNTSYSDYNYCGDDYITQSWTRTVLNLVPGFFALTLLIVGAGLALMVLKKEGVID